MSSVKSKNFWLYVLCLPIAVIVYYFVFNYPLAFNYEILNNGHQFAITFAISLMFLFTVFMEIFNRKKGPVIASILLILALLVFIFSDQYSYGNEYFSVVIVATIVYFIFSHLSPSQFLPIIWIFLLVWMGELIIVFILMVETSGNYSLISATMYNSGILAQYIVLHLPLFGFLLMQGKLYRPKLKLFFFVVFGAVSVFVVFAITAMASRTAIIATITMILVALYLKKRRVLNNLFTKWRHRYLMLMLFIMVVPLLLYFVYQLILLKKLSALGRINIWQISANHIPDHLWFGVGIGRYTWYYPQWQADYFKHTISPSPYQFLSASESYLAFNEYLQLFQSIGIIGFCAFLIIIIRFFCLRSALNASLLNTLKVTVMGILCCAFTSYTLHVNAIILLFVFCLAAGFCIADPSKSLGMVRLSTNISRTVSFSRPVLIVVSTIAVFYVVNKFMAFRKWERLTTDYSIKREEVKQFYKLLYPSLNRDGKFLAEYGRFLGEDAVENAHAVRLLEESGKYFISAKTVRSRGYAYWTLKDYPPAIIDFEWLANFQPNRFTPKIELLKLYVESGEFASAKNVAEKILSMPVKVPSEEVEMIKSETKQILEKIQNKKL